MRSIGKRWIKEVKRLVDVAKKNGFENIMQIQDYVRTELPEEVFDTWEMAYQEINGIVHDYVMKGDK